jgi:hypothetical protein
VNQAEQAKVFDYDHFVEAPELDFDDPPSSFAKEPRNRREVAPLSLS